MTATSFFKNLMMNILQNNLNQANEAKINMVKYKNRVNDIENTMANPYNDKINNVITQQMFSLMSKKFNDELEDLLQ